MNGEQIRKFIDNVRAGATVPANRAERRIVERWTKSEARRARRSRARIERALNSYPKGAAA